MAELNPRRVSRNQLARICGNDPELIKAFEALFNVTGTQGDAIDLLTILTEVAQQAADSNASQMAAQSGQVERIASALEVLALAPVPAPPLPADDFRDCPACAATREALAALTRRVDDLESR